jgi:hypothetical protein
MKDINRAQTPMTLLSKAQPPFEEMCVFLLGKFRLAEISFTARI